MLPASGSDPPVAHICWAILVLSLLILGNVLKVLASSAGNGASSNAAVFNVTGLFPLSGGGSGDRDECNAAMQNADAFLCAINRVNADPSLLPGITLNPIVVDSMKQLTIADVDFNSIGANSIAVIGPANSFQFLETTAVLLGESTAQFNYELSLQVSELSAKLQAMPILHVFPDEIHQAQAIFDTCLLFGWRIIGEVFSYDAYGLLGQELAFSENLSRRDINSTCSITIDGESIDDYQAISNFASCIDNKNVGVVLIWAGELVASQAISKIAEKPGNAEVIFLATSQWSQNGIGLATLTRPQPSDRFPSFPVSYLHGTLVFLPDPGPQDILAECQGLCTVLPRGLPSALSTPLNELQGKANYVQDSVLVLANAMDTLLHRCSSLDNVDCSSDNLLTGNNVAKAAVQTTTFGYTGPIRFLRNGRRTRDTTRINIFQYSSNGQVFQVGYWNSVGVYISKSALSWKGNGRAPKSEISSVTDVYDTFAWDEVALGIACLGILLVLLFAAFFIWHRRHPVVRHAPLHYLLTLIFGICALFVAAILIYVRNTTLTCLFKILCLALGVTIIYGCILAKAIHYFRLYTEHRTSTSAGEKKTVASPLSLSELFTVVSLALLGMAVIVALAYSIGGVPAPILSPQLENTLVCFITCAILPAGWQLFSVIAAILYVLLLSGMAAMLLLLAREQRSRYNDQRYLTYFSTNLFILGIILTILYFIETSRVSGLVRRYIVRAMAMLVIGYGTIFLIFLPKAIYIWNTREADQQEDEVGELPAQASSQRQSMATQRSVAGGERPPGLRYSAGHY